MSEHECFFKIYHQNTVGLADEMFLVEYLLQNETSKEVPDRNRVNDLTKRTEQLKQKN